MTAEPPREVLWFVHRVASSQRYASGLIEIQTQWSCDDVLDAIEMLDMYSVLDDRAAADARGDEVIG